MVSSAEGVAHQASPRERFHRLRDQWKEESRYLSNTAQMALLAPYQRIIGMGTDAVPYIVEELRREPDHWFWALEAITEENPVSTQDSGRVPAMTAAWLRWGIERGFIALMEEAVYRGAVSTILAHQGRRRLGSGENSAAVPRANEDGVLQLAEMARAAG